MNKLWLENKTNKLNSHPSLHLTGVDMLMKAAGKDCTSLFSILDNLIDCLSNHCAFICLEFFYITLYFLNLIF